MLLRFSNAMFVRKVAIFSRSIWTIRTFLFLPYIITARSLASFVSKGMTQKKGEMCWMHNTHGQMINAYKHVTEKSTGKSPHGKLCMHVTEIGSKV